MIGLHVTPTMLLNVKSKFFFAMASVKIAANMPTTALSSETLSRDWLQSRNKYDTRMSSRGKMIAQLLTIGVFE